MATRQAGQKLGQFIVHEPWKRDIRPDFTRLAQYAVLKALRPGMAMSTQQLWSATGKINQPTPEVLVTEPYAPEARQLKDKAPPPQPSRPEQALRSITHMKKHVLPKLENMQFVEKVHRKRVLSDEEIAERVANLSKAARKKAEAAYHGKSVDEWVWQRCAGLWQDESRVRELAALEAWGNAEELPADMDFAMETEEDIRIAEERRARRSAAHASRQEARKRALKARKRAEATTH